MKTEHERVIEAMAESWCARFADYGDDVDAAEAALRAAAKEGFVLARVPDEVHAPQESDDVAKAYASGWSDCLYETETIELDKE